MKLPRAHKNMEKETLKHIDKFKVTEFVGVNSERLSRSLGYFYDNLSSTKSMRDDLTSILEGPKIKHDLELNLTDFYEECLRC